MESTSAALGLLRSAALKLDLSVVKGKEAAKGLVAPASAHTPTRSDQLNLSFADLSYCVRSGLLSKERKQLLSDINGNFRPGELTVIMGPSGAGKTTLIDILAGFTTSRITGNVHVNGRPRNLSAFRRSSAYIMQDDNLQPLLTVQEAMEIAAELKLDSTCNKQKGIDTILEQMGLDTVRKTYAGALSGGQKKRLTIALELISNPPIMFFDEPTSGLDSVSARQCTKLLKSLAHDGRTIICTMHQPSAILFDMIDHLYVVANGQCAYAGSAHNLVAFLKGLDLQCPHYHSPVDYLLELINGDYGDHLPRMVAASENGKSELWRGGRRDFIKLPDQIQKLDLPLLATPHLYDSEARGPAYYATGFWKQMRTLLWRNAIKLSRDRILTFTRLTMHLVIALMVGTIFFKIGQDAAYAIDNFNLLFFSLMFLMYSAFSCALITFPAELPVLTREHFNRWYKLRSFYIANKLADLPVQVLATATFTLVVYYMSGQIPELRRTGLFVLMCIIVTLVAQTIGLIIGTAFNIQNGVVFGPFLIMPFTVFSGFFVHLNDAHPYLQWVFHTSFLKYGFEGVMIAIYGYDRAKLKCSEDYCHFLWPKKLLDAVDMKNSDYWFSIIVLVGLYFALDILSFVLLRLKLKSRTFR